MTRFGFVTGLKAESKLIESWSKGAGRAAPAIVRAGADAGRAQAGAAGLIAEGAQAIVSFGLCGGLDPALRPGTLILAESVAGPDRQRFDADPVLRARVLGQLRAAGLAPVGGTMLGRDRAVASAVGKIRLRRELGAVAVDMESHGVARAAAKAGVPFLVLRAVADPAARDLPHAALVATGPDGGVRTLAVLGALLSRPWEIAAMFRLARDARAGFNALERAAGDLLGGG